MGHADRNRGNYRFSRYMGGIAIVLLVQPAVADEPEGGTPGDATSRTPSAEASDTPPSDSSEAPTIEPEADDARIEAQRRFERGLALFQKGAWDVALVEFQASRQALENKSATRNAALCLWRLHRYDEAIEAFETLLVFPSATDAEKKEARESINELSGLIAYVTIDGETGVAFVDGRERGRLPLLQPIRVAAGARNLRIEEPGFAPFETRIDLRAGERTRVSAELTPLGDFGTLSVRERSGSPAHIVVDGVDRGLLPWSGNLPPGPHAIYLVGEVPLGTPPIRVNVRRHQRLDVDLNLESLPSTVAIAPTPTSATIFLDGVPLGEGAWEGRLQPGRHTLALENPGYHPDEVSFDVGAGDHLGVAPTLRPTVKQAVPASTSGRFIAELALGIPLVPSLGGVVSEGCENACQRDVGMGFDGRLIAGYQLPAGIAIGIMSGFWTVGQSVQGRSSTLEPVGKPTNRGLLAETLQLSGIRLGAWGGLSFGETWVGEVRTAGSVVIGSVRNERLGRFVTSTGSEYSTGTVADDATLALLLIEPELRFGLEVAESSILSLGVTVPIGYAINDPQWSDTEPLLAGDDGFARYEEESLLSPWTVGFAPSVAWRLKL